MTESISRHTRHFESMKRIRPSIIAVPLLAIIALASGCATGRSAGEALVCPQCKVVTITRTVPVFDSDGNLPPRDEEVTETRHSCPGCQGALTTFFQEGKLRHKCSICEQTPFSCPVAHR